MAMNGVRVKIRLTRFTMNGVRVKIRSTRFRKIRRLWRIFTLTPCGLAILANFYSDPIYALTPFMANFYSDPIYIYAAILANFYSDPCVTPVSAVA
jgi:hypothetical protein